MSVNRLKEMQKEIPLDERDNWSLGEGGKKSMWISQTRGNMVFCLNNAGEDEKSLKISCEISGFD